ncbi:MAG: hypothetical protein GXO04_04610 [Aquificae bacterium]|nr:hypothetical protein [Aquificota bacterium]
MKKIVFLALWLFLLAFSMTSFYVAYSAFTTDRDKKIAQNLATILMAIPERKVVILPYPELMLFKVRKGGEFYMSANAIKPVDLSRYEGVVKKVGALEVEVYIKRATLDDFLIFLVSNPVFGALLAFTFVIYISFFYLTVNEFREVRVLKPSAPKRELNKEEILKPLKALRLLLKTQRILKEESISKANELLDDVLRKLENK